MRECVLQVRPWLSLLSHVVSEIRGAGLGTACNASGKSFTAGALLMQAKQSDTSLTATRRRSTVVDGFLLATTEQEISEGGWDIGACFRCAFWPYSPHLFRKAFRL